MPSKKMLIYLDTCCFNRPYDEQKNLIVRLETEAKLTLQKLIRQGVIDLVWSFMLEFENDDNPWRARREQIECWQEIAVVDCDLCAEIQRQAAQLQKLKLRPKDAAHLACAIYVQADCFITTDKKILNKPVTEIICLNPIDFLRRYFSDVD